MAANDAAKADAAKQIDGVTSATPNNTLIAEMKGGTSGDIQGVPAVTVSGNTVSYTLPKKDGVIGGVSFPYGGYVGKGYVLVVKVQIRDDVTDSQIEEMRTAAGGDLTGLKGVPNTSELLIDGTSVMSNTVRAVPPAFQEPTISKEIKQKVGEVDQNWYDTNLYLNKGVLDYMYRIGVKMPYDTSTYEKLDILDTLDNVIEISDENALHVSYTQSVGGVPETKTLAPADYALGYDKATNKLSVSITNKTLLAALSGTDIWVTFPVKVKADADLGTKYRDITKDIRIDNRATYSLNGRYTNESNQVTAIIPTPEVSLKKITTTIDGNTIGLFGAEFTLYDNTGVTDGSDGVIKEIKRSEEQGDLFFGNLLPGHSYVIKETQAPQGYIPSNKVWKITVGKQNEIIINEVAADGATTSVTSPFTVDNTRPEVPQPVKSVKGEGATPFIPAPKDSPYKLTSIKEEVTYRVEVPIGNVAGYTRFEFFDKLDMLLIPTPNTLVVSIKENNGTTDATPSIPTSGFGGIQDGEIQYVITDHFEELANKTLVFEFKAKIATNVQDVFAKYPDGIIPNKATININGTPKDTNETNIQVSKGKVSITKLVAEDATKPTETKALPEGSTASFELYKVVGAADSFPPGGTQTPDTPDTKDSLVRSVTVSGAAQVLVDNLDTGTYYFIETSAPIGYAKQEGRIGEFTIPGSGGTISAADVSATNIKAGTPTIEKQIRSLDNAERGTFSGETLPIAIGEKWEYAIDIQMPPVADNSFQYTVTDDVPSIFEITGLKFLVSTEKDASGMPINFIESQEIADNFYKPTMLNPNKIRLEVPQGSPLSGYNNAVIRILVETHVKAGTNLLSAG